MKEKGVVTKGEQDATVEIEQPSIATEAQPSVSSFPFVQSYFKAELRAIIDKQVR